MLGSLCVNAGKGVRPIEAQVGAFMEAIEFAVAEPAVAQLPITAMRMQDVIDGATRPEAILDFCPIVRATFDPAAELACVEAAELMNQQVTWVPAELVLLPYVGETGTGKFGSHSNGLASGNTIGEATLHGVLEIIERDARSFNNVRDRSVRIDHSTLPSIGQELVSAAEAAGLQVCIRALPNDFGFAVFEALLWDPFARTPAFMNGGYGCHLSRDVALVRAITEAIQSRLSWIHGGRDDLAEAAQKRSKRSRSDLAQEAAQRFSILVNWASVRDYDSVIDSANGIHSVDAALALTFERLAAAGVRHICRVDLSKPAAPLHVVRVIVPRLEYFDPTSHRIGPRLRDFIRSNA
jgi:ribosomal protein S12 methylthiotransferase accessory factor